MADFHDSKHPVEEMRLDVTDRQIRPWFRKRYGFNTITGIGLASSSPLWRQEDLQHRLDFLCGYETLEFRTNDPLAIDHKNPGF